ncbi:Conserved_hypothetical protein [Hexamita inflata]|uniref:Uncharacterized protein n=1 Tax=Hexamita inflata TaxID=28002 RepID=A0AA86QGV0_9EUKA|nr:Conserved hypothetical protein [Hexamita inflata]
MQHYVIESKEELLNHLGFSQKLEICDLTQMKNLLEMNIQPEVWEDASNRNLLFFNLEFVQGTKEFVFDNRKIEYINLISFLANLTELNLQNNQISDISCIAKLKNLKELQLSFNSIEDISALQHLPDLSHLNLQVNQITSYTLNLPNLVELKLGYNKLQDISGFQHSPKLEILYLFKTETTDLRTIPPYLFGLKELDLSQNNLTEISYLSNFVDLQILSLDYNQQLQNIGPLKFCIKLTKLDIADSNVSDIWPLQFMKNLKTLEMAHTKVVDLHPLQNLYKLEKISAYGTRIMDVSPLSNLTQLIDLFFSCNKITNVETLKNHPNFSKYRLQGQKVPTTDELKFYSKILSVHSSHTQIRKHIQAESRVSKFRESLSRHKEYIKLKIFQQIQVMNKKIEIWAQFIQNSYADQ